MNAGGFHPSRGALIDIGGRRLRAVAAGPADAAPLVVLECGAFGCAADWAVVQQRLAARGLRSLAYDRAGLGYSDPGPDPRDGRAIAEDLEALLDRLDEDGPLVYVGHSMAGLMARVFVPRNAERVLGVVLVDAVTPEMIQVRRAAAGIHAYRGAMKVVGAWASAGFMRPVSLVIGDLIGLEGEARSEKRRIYGSAGHTRWAAREVQAWPATSAMGREAGAFPADLPVAVVTAGDARTGAALKALQMVPAQRSSRGYVDHVKGANHASLLGKAFADPIVAGVEHVLKTAR
ncbi:alpha/beta fold hydrolase [Phenylobacterium sp.]|jgi:pimeloyl-ACP methyl ester carboxylesterase|uniref:alpha/beta fold hydrolase n=1 Tax=Phenylobacterium sp. TaxID=1871053 RepID=UPI0035B27CD2